MSNRTIGRAGKGEYTEKKSRFYAEVIHVESEEEAEDFLKQKRKQYYDARHHCSAYRIGNDPEIVRSRDDGEPAGSAGRPILNVLEGEDLHDTMAVVTRYFGGTLLGVGGLVRAYTQAVQDAIRNAEIIDRLEGFETTVSVSYNDAGKLNYEFTAAGIPVLETRYEEQVVIRFLTSEVQRFDIRKKITEWTSGRAVFLDERQCRYVLSGSTASLL